MASAPSFGAVGPGEGEPEDHSVGRARLSPQSASMSFNDRTGYGEAHSSAASFGGVKGMEDLVQVLLTRPNSGVFHRNMHTSGIRSRFNAQFPSVVLNGLHRLDGVDDQIEHDLLELHAISQNSWNI